MTEHELLGTPFTLERAGVTCWRVCDRRVPRGQGRFIAFVEQKGDVFEVMQLSDDFVWTTFENLAAALAFVVAGSREAEFAGAVNTLRGLG